MLVQLSASFFTCWGHGVGLWPTINFPPSGISVAPVNYSEIKVNMQTLKRYWRSQGPKKEEEKIDLFKNIFTYCMPPPTIKRVPWHTFFYLALPSSSLFSKKRRYETVLCLNLAFPMATGRHRFMNSICLQWTSVCPTESVNMAW